MARIAVCLSGAGNRDGSEIHESVATLLAIDKLGHTYKCFAPNKPQKVVINYLSGAEEKEQRNVLKESARIARGNISDIKELKVNDFDALVFPGGVGSTLNICTFAKEGINCTIDTDAERAIMEFHNAKKPICAICIAPMVLACAFRGKKKVKLTIGSEAGTITALEKMGAQHENCKATDCVIDRENKIVTTPAYMVTRRVSEVFIGIEKAITELVKLI